MAGCVSERLSPTNQGRAQPLRLMAGDRLRIELRALSPVVPLVVLEYRIADTGRVVLVFKVPFQLAGLTPAEAALAIHEAYVPHFYKTLEVRLAKVAEFAPLGHVPASGDFVDFAKGQGRNKP